MVPLGTAALSEAAGGRFVVGWVRTFRSRNKVGQIDLYIRWALNVVPWFSFAVQAVAIVASADGSMAGRTALALAAGTAAQCWIGMGLLQRALDRYLGKPAELRRRMACSLVLLAVTTGLIMALPSPTEPGVHPGLMMTMSTATPPLGAYCLLVRKRVYAAVTTVGSVLTALLFSATGATAPETVGDAVFLLFICGWIMLVVRMSGWMLAIVWEVDAAREIQARLAVAEERLRFSRDMHDVMGRNLAVIALKSELAVQLGRRGSPAALEQMAEVQRIAQESQREVREVVRGYREADLHTELEGARGVLSAAGIECRIDGSGSDRLPAPVQSALGWVVREATTNVLRHAEATRCAVRLRVVDAGARAVLVIENDGVRDGGPAPAGKGGSGIAGLRERLAVLGGTLVAGPGDRGTFRLTAEIGEGTAA
ncbi:sensor histidine kinase [Streptomyces sp. NPDC001262]|uniref:sensor histidine kinase n=1 Tax=unclassified Streptomyces TaxID=2593676 RepID=UPI00367F79A0